MLNKDAVEFRRDCVPEFDTRAPLKLIESIEDFINILCQDFIIVCKFTGSLDLWMDKIFGLKFIGKFEGSKQPSSSFKDTEFDMVLKLPILMSTKLKAVQLRRIYQFKINDITNGPLLKV